MNIKLGQIYAGRMTDGSPAVVRVQNRVPGVPEKVQVIRLDDGWQGVEGHISTDRLAGEFALVSEGPEFTAGQVAGWLREVTPCST